MLAWAQYLQALGKEVTCVIPDAAPDFLMWLLGSQTLLRYDKHPDRAKEAFDKADLVCCLDYNDLSRTGDMADVIAQSKAAPTAHRPPCGPDRRGGALRLPSRHVEHVRVGLPSVVADGSLRTDDAADGAMYLLRHDDGHGGLHLQLQCASRLSHHQPPAGEGVDKDRVYNRVYHNYSPQAIKFRSYVIFKKLRVLPASHAAYYTVTRDEMRRFQFVRGDLEGVVNIPQKIKKLKLSISLREDTEKDQVIRVSLRSGNGSTAARWRRSSSTAEATKTRQADAWKCSIEEAEQVVLRAIMAYKEQLR